LLPALAIAAIAVTGCGGSSKKSTTSTTATAATSTTGGGGSSGLSTSTPLNSPLAQRLFKAEAVSHGLPAAQADKFVTCLENKFASQGLKTFADASRNSSRTRLDSENCALSVKTGG
jgi:hypothetical protein